MGDERIKAVLLLAAEDPEFMKRLGADRDGTIDDLDLSESEKALLKSIPRDQLLKMVETAKPILKRRVSPVVAGGCLIGGAVLVGMMTLPTLGHTSDRVQEMRAAGNLKQLGMAQIMYKEDYDCYADLPSLRRENSELFESLDKQDYAFKIELSNDSFVMTAVHKSKPNQRKAFKVGPDLKLDVIEK